MKSLYLIGSLRNPNITTIANRIRLETGIDVFDDWISPGPEADDHWKDYEQGKGNTYADALQGHAAKHIFAFDKYHLDRCDAAVLIAPAGKSAHLELGYTLGRNKPGFILLDDPERWDVMYQFATGVYDSLDSFIAELIRRSCF